MRDSASVVLPNQRTPHRGMSPVDCPCLAAVTDAKLGITQPGADADVSCRNWDTAFALFPPAAGAERISISEYTADI